MASRFLDPRTTIDDLVDEVLVVCPRCAQCARIAGRRMVCPACGLAKEAPQVVEARHAEARDPWFGEPLWLQVRCAGHTLWAFNRPHLELLEAFVGAKRRERVRDPSLGWSNRSLVGRLPRWIQSARHRAEVLAALATLAARLPRAS